MIRLKISGINFDPIINMIDHYAHPDMHPLATRLGEIMVAGNRRGLLANEDADGGTMDPPALAEYTIKHRGGSGPPLVPKGDGSRAISDFQYRIEDGTDQTLVIGEWPNSPWIHFHVQGGPIIPKRNPVGIRPQEVEEMRQATYDFAASLVGGRS